MAKKMDPKLVATLQPHEISYIAARFGASKSTVRAIIKQVGRSRAKIYEALKKEGYTVVKKVRLKDFL